MADSVIELDRTIRKWSYVIVALTFVWLFALMILLKMLRWYQGAFFTYAYPVACLVASVLALKSAHRTRVLFATLNFISALAWSAFVSWAVIEFTRHFWK